MTNQDDIARAFFGHGLGLNPTEMVGATNICPTCEGPQLGAHYQENPNEYAPCLVCG